MPLPGHDISPDLFVGDSIAKSKKYVCVKCSLLLKDAVQTTCGHWLCQPCIEKVFYSASIAQSSPACPSCNEDLRSVNGIAKYNVDECVRREVRNLMMVCENREQGCFFHGRMPDYECHICTFVYKAAERDTADYVVQARSQHEVMADTQMHLSNILQEAGKLVEEAGSKLKQAQHTSNVANGLSQAPVQPVNRVMPSNGMYGEGADSTHSLGHADKSLVDSIGHSSAGKKASLLAAQPDMSVEGAVGGQVAERRSRRSSPNLLEASPPDLNFTFQPDLPPKPLPKPPEMLPSIELPPQIPVKKRRVAATSENLPPLPAKTAATCSNPPPLLPPSLQQQQQQQPPPVPPRPTKPPQVPSRLRTKRPPNLPLLSPSSPLQHQPMNSPQDVGRDGTIQCKKCNAVIRVRGITRGYQSGRSASDGRLLQCQCCVLTLQILKYVVLEWGKQPCTYPPRHEKSTRQRLHSK